MNKLDIKLLAMASTLFIGIVSFEAQCGVNIQNGNFFISYSDSSFKNTDFKLSRTYNSKSIQKGLFGFGWGSVIETYLTITPSGTLRIQHNGGGSTGYFEPLHDKKAYEERRIQSLQKMEEILLEEEQRNDESNTYPKNLDRMKQNLQEKLKKPEYRHQQWRRLIGEGKVEEFDIPVGTKFKYICT